MSEKNDILEKGVYAWLQERGLMAVAEAELTQLRAELERMEHLKDRYSLMNAQNMDNLQRTLVERDQLRAEVEGMRGVIERLVKEADHGNPFCSVGHLVEHVVPEARGLIKREAKKEKESLPDKMLYVGGSDRAYRCDCGCNVFKEYKPSRYRCNSCKETYTGEQPTPTSPQESHEVKNG